MSEAPSEEAAIDVFEVEATVLVLIPAYHQVEVRSRDGHRFTITRHTYGVNLETLRVGQRLLCRVTKNLPRVLTAQVLD